ncbi:MAG: hypothetical protein ACRBN8_21795 [Nannocystales bacterium]
MSTGDTRSSGEDSGGGAGFITKPDGGGCPEPLPDGVHALTIECSVQDQDCCPGDACRAWANDGGDTWNASRCGPVDPDPAQVGEPCSAEGSAVAGLDSCDLGLMCWEVDAETLQGTCAQYCGAEGPACEGEGEVCGIFNDGYLPLCLPACDPLAPECAQGSGCYPNGQAFVCLREGERLRTEDLFHPDCPAGTFSTTDDAVTGCPDDGPCCTSLCDLNDPESCGGAECLPYFENPLPGQAALGYCTVAS